ncbi:N-acetylglucosamine-6-phosphate deacetylase [Lysinibacillus contaminans]|uniref:N-acetylglucosamine-6-phosphate deacetylase n=1 Tax=Lysinibacillus contaminans TaxID=1293441 RepID=A0ABR5JZM8_9BACI|nr:N-acetylglucosamine-6-phosphate deacetylase [Lysinibacillus contaminans]KOS67905.1 N-acetylglucosamine-6-phosphate deacetylase [Lysinibacillus contaminans]
MANTFLILNGTIVNHDQVPFDGDVFIENGRIKRVGKALTVVADQVINAKGKGWLLFPGYIDMHIHGSSGNDAMDATDDALHNLAHSLVKEGVTSFLATTMTQAGSAIEKALANIALYENDENEAELLGVHVEGPYISSLRAGAQPIEYIKLPSIKQFNRWQELSGERIKQITIAPEIEGGFEFIEELSKQGIVVSIGHSDATTEEVEKAVQLGAKQATHLFNQMRPFHHREPGVVGSVLVEDNVKVEVIVDFVHSHPKAVELAYRSKGASGLILITDAMRAKGLSYGEYDLGGQTVSVTKTGAHLSSGALAGSVLTMELAVKNMQTVTNCSLQELVAMSSTNAAEQLQLATKGCIAEGYDADFVILDQQLNVQKTICRGKVVFESPEEEKL